MERLPPVIRTKIILPSRRAELLSRQRLLNALSDLMERRLIIIAAPAGYGKTSLLIDFSHQVEWPVCWFALDPLDQDLFRFAAHLISSLQVRFHDFGAASMVALQSVSQDLPNLDILVAAIVNDAYEHIDEHFILVLDDFHLVDSSKQVNQFINRFLQAMDENCHVITASRTLLTLPDLPLMVARSQVGGLSFEELAFLPTEIQGFFLQNQHETLSDSQAEELARQSEGWITGLLLSAQMAGQEMADRLRTARVSGIGLYEYLAQQVLEQQPEDIQLFLLRTSLLEEFDAALCEDVIGKTLKLSRTPWARMMNYTVRSNLFILQVDQESQWLRYHHLFRDFLQARIQRDRPDEALAIQTRMADLALEHAEWERAYRLLQQTGRQEAMADLIEKAGSGMIADGRLAMLNDWIEALPPNILRQRPILISLQGSVAIMRKNPRDGLALLTQALDSLRTSGPVSEFTRTLIRRSNAYRMLGETQASLDDAKEALSITENKPELLNLRAEALRAKGNILFVQGLSSETSRSLEESLKIYKKLNDHRNIAVLSMEVGISQMALGEFAAAESSYIQALEHWQSTGNAAWQSNLLNNLGVLQHLRGNYESALTTFERAIEYAHLAGMPRMEAYELASIGDLYFDLDAVDEAMEAYERARVLNTDINDQNLAIYIDISEAHITQNSGDSRRSKVLLDQYKDQFSLNEGGYNQSLWNLENGYWFLQNKNFEEAIPCLLNALNIFSKEGQYNESMRAHLYLACCYYLNGDLDQAVPHLQQIDEQVRDVEKRTPIITAARQINQIIVQMKTEPRLNLLVNDLSKAVVQFDQKIPVLRRLVRRHASAVPLSQPKMIIRSLGQVQVIVNNHALTSSDWVWQASRDLFFFLLSQPGSISKETVGNIFWPDCTPLELKQRFKNTIYRLRHAAGKNVIFFEDEYYRFNRTIDYEYDAESFDKEIALAQQTVDLEEQIGRLNTAVQLYQGVFLPDINETWVLPERTRLQQLFSNALLKLASYQLEQRKFEQALNFSQRLIQEEHSEEAYRLSMQIFSAMGNRAGIAKQYEQCRLVLAEEFGSEPSQQTQKLYESLIR
ncbi:MAG TPA: tetratricopeptide repeat protein [Longilinea sp.]|nr:tetratricopeptide repeat protein [Longilinea sp.]